MTDEELNLIRQDWQLTAAQLAKILCLHSNNVSEYISGVSKVPCAVAMHIEALQLLPEETRKRVFEQRLNRKAHG